MILAFGFEDFFACSQDLVVLTAVLLGGGYVVQRAVFVLGVVGGDEVEGPCLRLFEGGEAFGRVGRMIFGRSKERFGKGIVIARTGSGVFRLPRPRATR